MNPIKLLRAIPILPVKDVERSAAFFRDRLGFELPYHKPDCLAILQRDSVQIHLTACQDDGWHGREGSTPIVSGAESFLAGTVSCRVGVSEVDALHREFQPLGVLHPNGQLRDTDYGTREFGILDPDGNLITFFETSPPD